MTTDVLLLAGAGTAVAFVGVLLVEGTLRPGYDPIYHTSNELELGERGWIQRANFFVMGAGVVAFAIGVHRSLNSTVGTVLLALFGNEIVHGKRSVTADTALRLARYFGTTPRFWLNLQAQYDLDIESDRLGQRLDVEVTAHAR